MSTEPESTVKTRLRRITPRTCLWPLAGSLTATFALSLGLTFRSNHHCFAGTCGEWLFPLQARVHVIIWYSWLSVSTAFLTIRAFHPEMNRFLARRVVERKIPLIGRFLSRGGLLMLLWVLSLYSIIIGVWWKPLDTYFTTRNDNAGIQHGSHRLAAVALTGHMCDVTMGMVLLPISRHSALASFFKISTHATLLIHVTAAYTLFGLVIVHGLLYVSWVPVYNHLSSKLQQTIPVLNPTYLYTETWPGNTSALGVWRASLIFTGSITALMMAVLFFTALPRVRKSHFNLFYFTHLLSIPMVVIVCLHASTMFYCVSPGLTMWFLDWAMRLFELRAASEGTISSLDQGWYW